MACGTAVVCANTSSLPEAAGGAAVLFDPTRVDDLAAALGRVLEDEGVRAAMGEKGVVQARQFTWARVALKTLEIYRAFSHKT